MLAVIIMVNTFTIIVFIFVILFIVTTWLYARSLIALAKYSYSKNTATFESKYKNTYQLMSDISFLNELWSDKRIKSINNEELEKCLSEQGNYLFLARV